jgi:large repetitive protein
MIRRSVLILLLLVLYTAPAVAAERLAGILPVVGSTEGAQGARFRTGLQLSNPSGEVVRGALVFREQGTAASPTDPRVEFELAARATQSFGDVVADMGASGLGSMEIFVIEGADPVVVARAYADGEGTLGVTVPLVKFDEALEAGESATLLVPSDLLRFRFNIGVRSLGEGAKLKVEVFDADGSLLSTLEEKVYPADAFVQLPSSAFAGNLLANQSLRVEVVAGSAIVYGTTTDNRTNDPSLQIDQLINKPPVLVDQDFIRNQDGSTTVELEFIDPDGDPVSVEVAASPQSGTLTSFERVGEDGWRFRAFYTPASSKAPSAAPIDQIVIIVRDGQGNVRRLIIEIPGGLNRAPTANDASYSIDENTLLEITLTGSDPDGDPLKFRIVTAPSLGTLGPIVPIDGTSARITYTPGYETSGSDSFEFEVEDPVGQTDRATISIEVHPVNDPPVGEPDGYTVLEDQVLSVPAPGVLSNDTDPDSATLTAVLATGPANGILALNPDGSFIYTPAPDFFGTDAFTYRASDGETQSGPTAVTITVTPVNDAPSFTKGADQTVDEDSGPATVSPWATAVSPGPANEAGQALTFNVTNDNNALFSVQPAVSADGALTYTPAPDANGAATVTVTLQDDGGTANGGVDTSAPQTFTITVTPVNDAPSFTKGADQTVLEDSGAASLAGWATGMSPGPADEAGQTLTFSATNDNTALFSAQPAIDATTGTLTFTPAADANGVATVTVTLQDSGSGVAPNVNTSAPQTFTITVTPVNDAPSFVKGADQTVDEDSGPAAVTPWATAVSPGPANESGQALTFHVTNDNNALFSVQPAVSADGALTYTPAPDANGAATVTVTLQDDGGTANGGVDTSAPQTFTITVTPVNDAPIAASQSVTTDEDTPILITLSASDIEGDSLTFNAPSAPSIGTLGAVSAPSCSVAGGISTCTATVTYTPNPDANGSDSFTFTVFDGAATSAEATVSITVTPVNDAPVGNPDGYGPLAHGTTLNVVAPGVLGNDTDVDGDALSAILVAGPSFASAFTLNADGSFTYTHDRSANLSDSFTYNVSDGTAPPVGPITVAITINANLPPMAAADGYIVAEGGTLNIAAPGVMANDADPEGFPTSAALVSAPTRGVLTFNADGSFGYVHDGSSTTSDTFTYQITDGLLTSAIATVTITVTQINDAPVAVGDNYAVTQGGTLTVSAPGVLGNDTDEEGSPLTALLVTGPASAASFTLNSDGSFSYQHDGSAGVTDSFTYRANDGTDDSNIATVTIAITAVNQVPVANDDAWSVTDGGTLTVVAPGVIANDTDAEGNPLTAVLDAGPSAAASFTLNADGSFAYAHDGSGAGTDTFTYHVNDGSDDSNIATVTITIAAVPNVAPTAVDDSYALAQGGTLTIVAPGVLGNDTDPEGNALSAALVSGPTRGTLTLGSDGSFIYVHGGSSTESDSFTYLANDGQDDSNVATVTIAINAVNTAPTANDDGPYVTSQNLPLTVPAPGVLGNDTDPESDTLTPILETAPVNGVLTLNANGSFTYIPAAGYFGTDSFTYFAFDGSLQSAAAATVSITVNENAVPVANDDTYSVNEDASLSVPALTGVLANDTDADGDTLTAVLVSGPANASSFTFNADGSFDYTPNANYAGSDAFTYRASDGVANSDVATVTITVNSVNDAPAGTDNSVTTDEDTAYVFAAADFGFTDPNDTPPNALLAVRIATLPGAGSLELSNVSVTIGQSIAVADINFGNLELVPAPNANGTPYTSFTFQVQDDGGTANGGVDLDPTPNTMTVNVTSVNDAPSGADNTVTTAEDTAHVFTVADFGFTDPNDTPPDALASVVIATLPGAGSLTLSGSGFAAGSEISVADLTAGNLAFTPDANESGSAYASFTFQVRDDGGTANGGIDLDPTPRTITIDVTAVNDAPAGTDNTVTTDEDVQYTFTVADFGFTDPNDTPANNLASVVITTLPGAGSLTLSGAGFAAGTEIPVANITAGNLTFLGAANEYGSPYASFTFQVRDDGGTANGGVDLDPTPNTMTINVTPVNDPPVGGADSWETFGNTTLIVDHPALTSPHVRATTLGSTGVLHNDSDPVENDPIVVTGIVGCADVEAPYTCMTAVGGTVVLQSTGAFAYTPLAGYTGGDSFQYVLTDVPSVGVPASVNVTVTLTVHEVVWYVDGSVTGPGSGVSTDPFNNFNSLNGAGGVGDVDGPNSIIFVHDSAVTGAIELENAQKLYGEGHGLSIARSVNGGPSPSTLVAAGANPVITAPNSPGVNAVSVLANTANGARIGIEIRGVTLSAPGAAANGIDATSANAASLGVAISKVTVQSAAAEGIDINQESTGAATVSLADVNVTATGTGIDLTRTAGALTITGFSNLTIHGDTAGSGIVINGALFDAVPGGGVDQVLGGTTLVGTSGNGVALGGMQLTNVQGDLFFSDLKIFADGGAGLRVGGTGSGMSFRVTPGVGVIEATGGPAVDMTTVATDLQLSSLKSTNTPTTGVSLTNVSDSASFNAVFSAGNTSTITTTVSATGPIFNVSGGNAKITYAGTINNSSSLARAVYINTWGGDDAGDDLLLSGAITENGAGILVNANTGARAITFSGGMTISTTTGEGFAATSNTTALHITGTNTISSTSATALRITNTPIGSSNLNFRSISSGNNTAAADPANGIVLNTTGAIGGLKITGNSLAGTGGTIQRSTSNGISLTNTSNVEIAWMQLNDHGDFAIRGSGVSGFSMANTVINGTNGNNAATDEGSVRFTELTGSASISNSNISGGFEDNFAVVNTTGTLNRITFSNVTIGANSPSDGNDGIKLEAQGSAVLNATIQNSFFTSARGDLFQMSVPGTGSGDLVFTGNTLSNNHPAIATGGGGVTLGSGSTSTMTMNIANNTFRDAVGHAVLIVKDIGSGSLSGNFSNNTIGVAAVANSGSLEGDGLKIQQAGQGTITLSVTGNQVRQYNNQGIHLQAGAGIAHGGNFNVTVSGNTIANPGSNPSMGGIYQGLHLNNGVAPGDSFQTCVNVGPNTITNSGRNGGTDFRLRARQSTTVRLPGYAGTTHDTGAVVTFVQGKLVTAASGSAAADAGSGGFIGTGTTCP